MSVIEHRNIVLLLFDSLSFHSFEQFENANHLASLSRLRNESVCFNRCYTPCPESSPARASLFTGNDPSVHGLWTNGVALPDFEQTFAQRLANAGYSTYLAGRCQLAGVSRWTTEQVRAGDFSHMDWAHGPLHRSRQNAYLSWLETIAPAHYSQLFLSQANPDATGVSEQQRAGYESLPDELSFNYWVGERVGDWITNATSEKPFLALAGFSVGDGMGAEPQANGDSEQVNKAALLQADAAIGQIIKRLQASNHYDDTVIVIASARGNCDSENANTVMSERSIKVPLLFFHTGRESKIVEAPVSTIDIAPTVLGLANVAYGPRMQGSSLPGVCSDAAVPRNWAMTRLRATNISGERNWHTSFCKNKMKLVMHHSNNGHDAMSLYDLTLDPKEQNNLAFDEAKADILEDMIDQMIDARCAMEDRTEPRIAEF